jgi:hypothetical protein
MNTLKTYKLANRKKFQVEYSYKSGKWHFKIGSYILMTRVPGGKENADRIAEILRKSWFRHGEIDGAARTAINSIVNANFKPLKNYRGKWDHNWSWSDAPTERIDDVPVVSRELESQLAQLG